MKKSLIFISFLIVLTNSCNFQSENLFEIRESVVEQDFEQIKNGFLESKDSVFYEDENYKVRKTCNGEWGGSIWFKNKKTGIEYSCAATCPIAVNRLHNKYIVTNSLPHMEGLSKVIEIINPDSMEVFEPPKPIYTPAKDIYNYLAFESNSSRGTKVLVDTVGILTIGSFPFENQLFHIITDLQKTSLAKIESGKYVTIDTLSNNAFWAYDPAVIKIEEGHHILFYFTKYERGYLDIIDNIIDIKIFN